MATKTRVLILLVSLFSIFIIIKIYDFSNSVSFGDYRNIVTKISTNKTIYNANEEVQFSYMFTYKGTKKTSLNICTDNITSIIMRIDTPVKSERDQFPKEYQIENILYDGNNPFSIFNYTCPKNLLENNGLIRFSDSSQYIFNFKFTYIIEGNDYFLLSKNKKIKLHKAPTYYYLYASIKEGIMSSDEASLAIGKNIYMEIENERLHIFIP